MNTFLSPAPISNVGRPVMHDEEFELRTFEDVGIHKKTASNQDELVVKGVLIITNFRLIKLVENGAKSIIGWEIHFRCVKGFSSVETMFVASKRINLDVKIDDRDYHIQLKFNKGGKDEFLELLERTLTRKSWEEVQKRKLAAAAATAVAPPLEINEKPSLMNAGIGGILARQTTTMKNADSLARAALTDLDSLAQKAREVVDVVQKYAAIMQESKQAAEEDGLSETSSQVGEVNEMETIMQNIGVISPVTRLSAGRLYHQQLARQLAEILLHQNRIQRLGGMITLTDLYYLYNRARGTELLSPDDLLSSVQIMTTLRLGMHLRTFPSGVKVVQLDSFDEEEWDTRLVQVIENTAEFLKFGITSSALSRAFSISLTLAKERLLGAEQRGHICRDESIEGLAFFVNRFQ